MKRSSEKGFTLVELLVALAILGVIVVICGRIFEQSNVSWNTGTRRAEMNMVGRGIADFISQDISRCVPSADFSASDPLTFNIVDESGVQVGIGGNPIKTIKYTLSGNITRDDGSGQPPVTLAPPGMVESPIKIKEGPKSAGELPGYVDIEVRVKEEDTTKIEIYTARAWLANRDRYKYDE